MADRSEMSKEEFIVFAAVGTLIHMLLHRTPEPTQNGICSKIQELVVKATQRHLEKMLLNGEIEVIRADGLYRLTEKGRALNEEIFRAYTSPPPPGSS